MGDEHHRVALPVQVLEHPQHLPAGVGIQGAGGLVGKDDGGAAGQSPGDGHPLLLSAGELVGPVVDLISQSHLLQHFPGPAPPFRFWDAGIHQRDLHIFQKIQLRQQIVLLKDKAQQLVPNRSQLVRIHLPHVPSIQQIGTGSGYIQTADDVHAGGFT